MSATNPADTPMPTSGYCLRMATAMLNTVTDTDTLRPVEAMRATTELANAWTRLGQIVLQHEKAR